MSSTAQNVWFIVGATVIGLVSAVSVVIMEKIRQKREQKAMIQNLARLSTELQSMRRDLENLRNLQRNTSKRNRRSKVSSISTTSTDDYVSATDGDSSDLEFYDVSDEEIQVSNAVDSTEKIANRIDSVLDCGKIEDLEAALEQLQEMSEEFPEDTNILWRIAKGYHRLANATDSIDEKQYYIRRGIEACETALQISPNIPEVHKWYAILVGSRAEIQPLRERISDGHLFKKHLDKALNLDPNDHILHHMLGRFAYEIASLKWYERKAAAAFYAEPPSATFAEALDHFMEVERLCKRRWKENKLFIAKCHVALGQNSDAIKWLEEAENIENQDEVDNKIHVEVKDLLKKYGNYR